MKGFKRGEKREELAMGNHERGRKERKERGEESRGRRKKEGRWVGARKVAIAREWEGGKRYSWATEVAR